MSPTDPPREDAPPPSTPFPFPTAEHHEPLPQTSVQPVTETPTEDAIDHGIEESFPASDPVSVSVTRAIPKDEDAKDEDAKDEDAKDGGAAGKPA